MKSNKINNWKTASFCLICMIVILSVILFATGKVTSSEVRNVSISPTYNLSLGEVTQIGQLMTQYQYVRVCDMTDKTKECVIFSRDKTKP